jgi:hypothetical protein
MLGRVESGHRKRRKVRLAVSAGGIAAVCTAILGVALVANISGTTRPVAATSGKNSPQPVRTVPPQAKAVPIEKLWPKAVHLIPYKLPDGHEFTPQTLADDRTLLATVGYSYDKPVELIAYDLKTKATRTITNMAAFAQNFSVGDGQVIWYTLANAKTQIWTVPVSGGRAVKVAETPGVPDYLAVADGKAFWSLNQVGGLLQAPLTGGRATPVPGTAHEHILDWPWVASPGKIRTNRPVLNQIVYGKARNLRTGETRTAKVPAASGRWGCGPSLCYAFEAGGTVRATLRDGTLARTVSLSSSNVPASAPSLDRFIFDTSATAGVKLYDFKTGKIGSVPPFLHSVASQREPYNRLYPAEVKNGYLIVDLAAIP